jgi:hypothetical protein
MCVLHWAPVPLLVALVRPPGGGLPPAVRRPRAGCSCRHAAASCWRACAHALRPASGALVQCTRHPPPCTRSCPRPHASSQPLQLTAWNRLDCLSAKHPSCACQPRLCRHMLRHHGISACCLLLHEDTPALLTRLHDVRHPTQPVCRHTQPRQWRSCALRRPPLPPPPAPSSVTSSSGQLAAEPWHSCSSCLLRVALRVAGV